MTTLFIYGTLRHRGLLSVVLGREPDELEPATLSGYRVFKVEGADYPAIRAEDGAEARGAILSGLTDLDLARLDFYEFDPRFDYLRVSIEARTSRGAIAAGLYMPSDPEHDGGPWSLEHWSERHGDYTALAAKELMSDFATGREGRAQFNYTQMLVRSSSATRARALPKPTNIRSNMTRDAIDLRSAVQPYRNFFALTEQRLRFPKFDGTMSPEIEREGFLGGDAVTILPYDPVRDRVLVIEQFRFAPYMRGDHYPWVLEPVAGRIDPGETPEQTGRRELREEAGLEVRELLHVASYYPSPSAYSEYIYSYVGLCDLPDDAAGIGGLETEQEDIRSHVLSFDRAYELIMDGEADAAPLILSLMWLARERERLRNSA
jgi:nudix-type nucleoside diphosphatase (YffH/AdpP family)